MTENSMTPIDSPTSEQPLESWKEIAAYLNRDVSTVKRWEKGEGLPVHRHLHLARSSVYAYPSELDNWRAARKPADDVAPEGWLWSRPARVLAFSTMMLLTLVLAGGGLVLTPVSSAAEDGGMVARQILERGVYGTVSPDGRFLTDVDWSTGDLALVDLNTMQLRRLTNKGSWVESNEYAELSAVSPDGAQIAYAWFNGRNYDLRLVAADGSGQRVLYSHPDVEYVQPGAWSPDGKYVAATLAMGDKANQIVLVSAADGAARVLKSFDWRFPVVGPFTAHGRALLYDFPPREDSRDRDIFLLAIDGSRETPLITHPANDTLIGWSPDGQELLFRSDRTGTPGAWAIRIRDGKPDGAPRLVKPNLGRIVPVGLTAGGSFYYGVSTSLRDAQIAPLDLVTGTGLGTPKPIVDDLVGTTLWPRWSLDGKSLVYLQVEPSQPRNRFTIVVRSLDTGVERKLRPELTFDHQFHFRPSLSPDNRSILIATRDPKGRQGIYQVDAQTAQVSSLVRAEPGSMLVSPAWSSQGATLFYLQVNSAKKTTAIIARELKSGQERKLYEVVEPLAIRHFNISRDARQVAFVQIEQEDRSSTLRVMPVAGGTPREIFRVQEPESMVGPAAPGWTPDGRYILVRKFREQKPQPEITLWAVPSAGGEPKLLGPSPQGFLLGLDVHPDGKRLAFTAGLQKEELWVIENFLPAFKAAK